MSSVYGGGINGFGGKQGNQSGYVKQFSYNLNKDTAYWAFVINPLSTSNTIFPLNTSSNLNKDVNVLIKGDLTVNGNIINPSDRRLKENIENIKEEDVDNLLLLEPVHYFLKNSDNKKKHYGLIAQEVEKFYPTLVNETESQINIDKNNVDIEFYKGVNYLELIPLLVKKIQMMDNEIKELKTQLKIANN